MPQLASVGRLMGPRSAGVSPFAADFRFTSFATGDTIPGITFARASTATYRDSSGLIATATSGQIRIDHDSSGTALGVLVEEARTNEYTYSEDFSNAAWLKDTGTAITTAVADSPRASGTCCRLAVDSAGGSGTPGLVRTITQTTNVAQQYSIFVKDDSPSSATFLMMRTASLDAGGNGDSWFNPATGSMGTVSANHTASVEDYGNGWYRVTIAATSTTNLNCSFRMYLTSADASSAAITRDGTRSVLIDAAQTEEGPFPTTYIPTTTATVTRAADSVESSSFGFVDEAAGTIVFEGYRTAGLLTSDYLFILRQSVGTTDFIECTKGASNAINFAVRDGNVVQVSQNLNIPASGAFKTAIAWDTNDVGMVVDGGSVETDTSATLPSGISVLGIGRGTNTTAVFNGQISRVRYAASRLADAQIQAFTT